MGDLAGVKAGDTIWVGSYGDKQPEKVERVTKTHAIVGTSKYNLESGRRVGSEGFYSTYAVKDSKDLRAAHELRQLRYKARDAWDKFKLSEAPKERLEEVITALTKEAREREPQGNQKVTG